MIIDMKKLLLFGNNKEKSRLMKILHKMGCVEVSLAQKLDNTSYVLDENTINEYTRKLTQIEFYFDFIEAASKVVSENAKAKKIEYKPIKTSGLLIPKQSLTYEQFAQSSEEVEEDVFKAINELEKISASIVSLKSEIAQAETLKKQITPFKALPVPFDKIVSTKNTTAILGNVSLDKLPKVKDLEDKGAYVEVYQDGANVATLCVVVLKEKYDEVMDVLSNMEFSLCTLNYSEVPLGMIKRADDLIAQNNEKIVDLYFEAIKFENLILAAQRLHDYYTLEVRKLECEGFTSSTQTSYYLEAWITKDKADELDKELENSPLALSYVLRDPIEGEAVPTYCENNSIVDPYESVTNMFSAPKYKEIDPNPFVAFFFFLFFGMMLSDAGYGLVLAIGGGVILAMTKPKKGQSSLIKIVCMGGISTILWGIAFGSYFGISASQVIIPEDSAFAFLSKVEEIDGEMVRHLWCWFNPVEQPIMMLFLSVGMGIFQMLFGTGIKAVADFKDKQIVSGISSLCWFFLVLGIGGFAVGKMGVIEVPESVGNIIGTIGMVLLGIGLVLLMVNGAVGKKGFAMVTGAFASLYGIINFFSDLMSYTRIFGLGLATAVIGMVFNQIGGILNAMIGGFGGIIAFALIAIIGHVFSMAINALGSYVHDSRLQFVEFFGKFYTGGGELFKPLGSEMKYYYINNEKTQEVTK